MASLYTRPRSPYYWLKRRDPGTGKVVRESTEIRTDSPGARAKANQLRAAATLAEQNAPQIATSERWQNWLAAFLQRRYENTPSWKNAKLAGAEILTFVEHHQVPSPRFLTYAIASTFVQWRTSTKLLPPISANSAALRFVYLSVAMREAVRRGFATANPCRDVRSERTPAKQKLEITEDHQAKIESLLTTAQAWMREQWLILMRQGCRISETLVPLDRIDESRRTITFRIKGGRLHTSQLHPDLLPLVAQARAEGRKTIIEPPPSYNAIWSLWLKKHGFPYSAHCTRVTVITRLLRAGHSPALVCAFIGHTEEVNRIYRRLKPPDTLALLATLSAGASSDQSAPAAARSSRGIPGSSRARRARVRASSAPRT